MEFPKRLARGILLAFILTLTALLVFSVWKGKEQKAQQISQADGVPALEADMKLTDMEYTEMQEGRKVWTLHAQEARYFESDQKSLLKVVRLVLFMKDGGEVYLESGEGALYAGTKDIELWGSVRATVPQGYELASERVFYRNESRTVSSNEPVQITGPDVKLHGSRWEYVIPEAKGYVEGPVEATLVLVPAEAQKEMDRAGGEYPGR